MPTPIAVSANLVANSSLTNQTSAPVQLMPNTQDEIMYVLDLVGPTIWYFNTASVNGTSPPLKFTSAQPYEIPGSGTNHTDLSGSVSSYGPLALPKVGWDPIGRYMYTVYNEGNFHEQTSFHAITGGYLQQIDTGGFGIAGHTTVEDIFATVDPSNSSVGFMNLSVAGIAGGPLAGDSFLYQFTNPLSL